MISRFGDGGICGRPAVALHARMGLWFACVLAPGHDGECQTGGDCVAHGRYTCPPGHVPQCPHPLEECLQIILAWDRDLFEWEQREKRKRFWGGLAKHV